MDQAEEGATARPHASGQQDQRSDTDRGQWPQVVRREGESDEGTADNRPGQAGAEGGTAGQPAGAAAVTRTGRVGRGDVGRRHGLAGRRARHRRCRPLRCGQGDSTVQRHLATRTFLGRTRCRNATGPGDGSGPVPPFGPTSSRLAAESIAVVYWAVGPFPCLTPAGFLPLKRRRRSDLAPGRRLRIAPPRARSRLVVSRRGSLSGCPAVDGPYPCAVRRSLSTGP